MDNFYRIANFILLKMQKICSHLHLFGKNVITIFICLLLLPVLVSAANLRDPTMPAGYDQTQGMTNETNKKFVLDAILISSQRNVAVINNEPLRIGDRLLGFQLVKIFPQAVLLQGPGGIIKIPLLEKPIKQFLPHEVNNS